MSILNEIEKPADSGRIIVTIAGEPGLGKEVPVYTNVFTENGKKMIGELKIGDRIFGKNGGLTTVIGVFPQGEKEIWKMHFSEGTVSECGEEHLWEIIDYKGNVRTLTTKDISESYIKPSGQLKYKIPLCSPVNYDKKILAIPPYVLGVLISEGYISGNGVFFSNQLLDIQIKDKVESLLLPLGFYLSGRDTGGCYQYRINYHGDGNGFINTVKKLNLNVKSKDKFIPEIYKFSSIEDRYELLKGLMDGDGSCKKNRTSYSTMSKRLANDIIEIVQSLGGIAMKFEYNRENEGKGIEYRLNVKTLHNPFSLDRKAKEWSLNKKCKFARVIKHIEKTGVNTEQICIQVDSKDGLFLIDNYVVTHNTSLAGTFPKPIVIKTEDGLKSIPIEARPDSLPLVKTADQVFSQISGILKENHDYKTLVIDSVTQLETIFIESLLAEENEERAKQRKEPTQSLSVIMGGYGAGFNALAALHGKVRKYCQAIHERKGMNIVFVAHADLDTVDLPDQDPYSRYTLRLHKKSMPHYVDNVDMVGYIKLDLFTKGDRTQKVKKADSDGTRVMVAYSTANCVSKNRFGISEDIQLEQGKNPLSKFIKE